MVKQPVALKASDSKDAIDQGSVPVVGSLDQFVDRNYAGMYRYAFRLTGSIAMAEDLTQEAFLSALSNLNQLRSASAERSWLLSIVRRHFLRWLRQKSHAAWAQTNVDESSWMDNQSLPCEDQWINCDWVNAALATLSPSSRTVLMMYYFEDLSYAEIAQQLQMPIGTVMSRLSRGRQQMRAALEHAESSRSSDASPTTIARSTFTRDLHSHDLQPRFAQPRSTDLLSCMRIHWATTCSCKR